MEEGREGRRGGGEGESVSKGSRLVKDIFRGAQGIKKQGFLNFNIYVYLLKINSNKNLDRQGRQLDEQCGYSIFDREKLKTVNCKEQT